jgi:hypothetical protein
MAGLWEPVAGVFWHTPPAAASAGWSLWTVITCALLAAFAAVAVIRVIAVIIKPAGWHLRQHLGSIGGTITLTYLVVVVVVLWGRIDSLMTMPLNEVGDFLAGVFGPVGFLWLVFGFLQQGEELRQGTQALRVQAEELRKSVEQQSIMAGAALEQINAQREKIQRQQEEREKALIADFSITTIFSGPEPQGMVKNTIRIWNEGARATDLTMSFEPPIYGVDQLDLDDMRYDTLKEHSFFFNPWESPDEGVARIVYLDAEGNHRYQFFAYTLDKATSKLEFKKVYDARG